ncbi:MAG: sigma-54-dependent transcriptional regulator [Myxococcaceae bacterium]
MREYLEILLTRAGYQVSTAASAAEATQAIGSSDVDLVISDMKLGEDTGFTVLRAARALPSPPEVILITAYGTPEAAVRAMREGAYGYIRKPIDNEELKALAQKALEKREIVRENLALRSSLAPGIGKFWIGSSPAMQEVWKVIEKVALSPRSTVLITGESGTGKELVARAIHWKSARSGQPFVPVNCAALAEGLLESELFGHVRGAFTGAAADRSGLMVSAGEGTVLLDEIGDVSLATQVKLLRLLQERRVKPVGSSAEVPFNARVLAATNRRLDAEVKAGRFRQDLLYRLNVITIDLPPLRERQGDISVLARFFLAQMSEELGRPTLRFDAETLSLLERYPFPGNVRQLQNIVERAATLSDSDRLEPNTLPPALRGETETLSGTGEVALTAGFSLERYLDSAERRYLLEALRRSEGVKTRAAELLGLTFRSFRYRLAKHGLSEKEDTEAKSQ